MKAWHGDPELKARVVERMHQHRADDAIVQGLYQRLDGKLPLGYRGCAIGCLLDKQPEDPDEPGFTRPAVDEWGGFDAGLPWHSEVQRQFGIPYDLADQIDKTFEYFTDIEVPDARGRAAQFAVAVVEAVPIGADLSGVAAEFEAWWLGDGPGCAGDGASEDQRAAKLIEMIAAAPVVTS